MTLSPSAAARAATRAAQETQLQQIVNALDVVLTAYWNHLQERGGEGEQSDQGGDIDPEDLAIEALATDPIGRSLSLGIWEAMRQFLRLGSDMLNARDMHAVLSVLRSVVARDESVATWRRQTMGRIWCSSTNPKRMKLAFSDPMESTLLEKILADPFDSALADPPAWVKVLS